MLKFWCVKKNLDIYVYISFIINYNLYCIKIYVFINYFRGERKLKIELFRICIVVIFRLIFDGMFFMEFVEMLNRLIVYVDEILKG